MAATLRLRRIAAAAFALLAVALLAGTAAVGWLLASTAGLDVVLGRAIAALPPGALSVGAREGSVAGGLRLRDVVYADESVRITIDVVEATPRAPGLATRTVHLAALRLRGVRITLADAPPQQQPPWPQGLPRLDLPVGLHVDALELREVSIEPAASAGDAPPAPWRLDRAAAAVRLAPGRLSLEALAVEAPQGRLIGALSYAPIDDHALRAEFDATLAAGARAALRVDGALGAGRATLDGQAGGPFALAFDWRDAANLDRLGWSLAAEAEALEAAALGLPEQAPIDAVLAVQGGARAPAAAGPGLRIAASGRVAQGGHAVALRESRLRLQAGVVHAEPLALGLLDGTLDVDGTFDLDGGAMALAARAQGLAWGEGPARVEASGTVQLDGTTDDWRAALAFDLARGAQRAALVGRAEGDAEAIALAPFSLRTPGGRLEGEGRWSLDAGAAFTVQARIAAFDPAWLLPGWPGRLDGRLQVDGAAPADAPLQLAARIEGLAGTLRGQRVAGRARVDAAGDVVRVDADLDVATGGIAVRGRVAPAIDVEARLRAVDLAPWVDGARGAVDGRARVQGRLERPAIDADLVLLDGGWGATALGRASLRGALPARGDGRLLLRVEAVRGEALGAAAIDLALEGRVDEGRFTLAAEGIEIPSVAPGDAGAGRVAAQGGWRASAGWRRGAFALDALEAELPRLPRVALAAPARAAWTDRPGAPAWSRPAPACLALGAPRADGAEGRLCVEGDAAALRAEGRDLDLGWLAPLLPESRDAPLVPQGLASLEAERRVAAGGRARTALRLASPQGRIQIGGPAPETVFAWRALALQAEQDAGWRVALDAALGADGRLEARAAADPDGALSGRIALRLSDLALLEALSADLAAPRGVVEGALDLDGTVEAPRWRGAIAAAPFSVELPALGIAVSDGELRVEGGDDGQLRLRGRLPTGDGALEVAGRWSDDERPNALSLRGTDVRVLDTPDGRAWISPALDVTIADGIARVRGRVEVPRADLALDRFEQAASASPDVVVVDDPDAAEAATGLALDADFAIALGSAVRLRGFGFDGRLSGELQLRDRIDREPRARGTLTLAGEVRAYGQQLDLERGILRWGNVPIDEPAIDVRAVRPDSDPEVGVAVTGTAAAPVVEVWSRPPLPQAEALSWLMFGRPLATADGADAAQLQQAATSLGGSAVAQALAGQVGLDTASVGESRALGGTALTVGKRITPRLYVSYGMSLSGAGQVVTVTYALRRWLALQFETSLEQRVELEAKFDRD